MRANGCTPEGGSHAADGCLIGASEGVVPPLIVELYTYEEIGTDTAMRAWGDADEDGVACCGFGPSTLKLKSPRLVGLWAQTRLLHNGSVSSLEQLLCLTPRTVDTRHAQTSGGHEFGCELSADARRDLVAFLQSR